MARANVVTARATWRGGARLVTSAWWSRRSRHAGGREVMRRRLGTLLASASSAAAFATSSAGGCARLAAAPIAPRVGALVRDRRAARARERRRGARSTSASRSLVMAALTAALQLGPADSRSLLFEGGVRLCCARAAAVRAGWRGRSERRIVRSFRDRRARTARGLRESLTPEAPAARARAPLEVVARAGGCGRNAQLVVLAVERADRGREQLVHERVAITHEVCVAAVRDFVELVAEVQREDAVLRASRPGSPA